jgi:hypothetical protein
MKQSEITVRVHLHRGARPVWTTVWTCDLSHDYVSINADYRSLRRWHPAEAPAASDCPRCLPAAAALLPPGDLLRDRRLPRLWTSILISSFGNQVMMLALPLTAAVLLQATPTQMGLLTAIELAPFLLLSLPSGVWLDRVRKLPVYVVGETGAGAGAAQRAAGLVAGLADDGLAVRGGLHHRHGAHGGRQRGADRADPGGAARAAGRGACQERAGHLGRRGGRAGLAPGC